MLSRRHLRIRVMQALYAWHQSEDKNASAAESELLKGTERMYDLYLHLLLFISELGRQEDIYYEDLPASALTGQRLIHTRQLNNNQFIQWLNESVTFNNKIRERKISWQQDQDTLKKAFFELRKAPYYSGYVKLADTTKEKDITLIKHIIGDLVKKKEFIRHTLEEKNIYWAEGFEVIISMVIRTAESGISGEFTLASLYKDEEEDMQFMKDLLRKTIEHDEYFTGLIAERTESWDTERIALVDILLMKMALCEILYISNIPVKVSLNEYIDISKDYSTPNSKGFINGVIDNIVISLKKEGKIVKTGRGLLE